VTSHKDQGVPYYRSPESIRKRSFKRRMRGLDENEVYEYLDLLADQVQATDRERQELQAADTHLQADNQRLQGENQRLQTELQQVRAKLDEFEQAGDRVNEQVVKLFSQAQLVAEEIVDDVSRDARQRLGQARTQERQILDEAVASAGIEVRTFARTAQQQMQSIMDSFASQVERLGDAPADAAPGFPQYESGASFQDVGGWQIEAPRRKRSDDWGTD
jgi:DivIVA domain-containing protein